MVRLSSPPWWTSLKERASRYSQRRNLDGQILNCGNLPCTTWRPRLLPYRDLLDTISILPTRRPIGTNHLTVNTYIIEAKMDYLMHTGSPLVPAHWEQLNIDHVQTRIHHRWYSPMLAMLQLFQSRTLLKSGSHPQPNLFSPLQKRKDQSLKSWDPRTTQTCGNDLNVMATDGG